MPTGLERQDCTQHAQIFTTPGQIGDGQELRGPWEATHLIRNDMLGLWERRSMLSSATQPRWERVVFTVDSGAQTRSSLLVFAA